LEFIVSLVIVGIVGPVLGILAAKWADRRKFAHDRKLRQATISSNGSTTLQGRSMNCAKPARPCE
jgi:hypothetical protein